MKTQWQSHKIFCVFLFSVLLYKKSMKLFTLVEIFRYLFSSFIFSFLCRWNEIKIFFVQKRIFNYNPDVFFADQQWWTTHVLRVWPEGQDYGAREWKSQVFNRTGNLTFLANLKELQWQTSK
jgi:hypothetical protein